MQQLVESRSVSARAESYKKVRKQIYKKFVYLPMFFGIRDGKKSGSGINIPDPQHWFYREFLRLTNLVKIIYVVLSRRFCPLLNLHCSFAVAVLLWMFSFAPLTRPFCSSCPIKVFFSWLSRQWYTATAAPNILSRPFHSCTNCPTYSEHAK